MSQEQQYIEAGSVCAKFSPIDGVPIETGLLGESFLR